MTRPMPGLSETMRTLVERGHRAVSAPMLDIEARRIELPRANTWQAALVTSSNALVPLACALAPLGLLERARVVAVGASTAERGRALGLGRVASADGDAQALIALCRAMFDPADGPLVLATGAGQGLTLVAELRRAGFRILRRIAYAQVPIATWPPAADRFVREVRGGIVLFFSRSAAARFVRLIPEALQPALAGCEAIGISEAALEPVARLPWRRVRVAVRPNSEDVLRLL